MTSCFIGLVTVAGLFINPCNIASMTPYDHDTKCYVAYNSGNAWNGQHDLRVPAPCSRVNDAINKKLEKHDGEDGEKL